MSRAVVGTNKEIWRVKTRQEIPNQDQNRTCNGGNRPLVKVGGCKQREHIGKYIGMKFPVYKARCTCLQRVETRKEPGQDTGDNDKHRSLSHMEAIPSPEMLGERSDGSARLESPSGFPIKRNTRRYCDGLSWECQKWKWLGQAVKRSNSDSDSPGRDAKTVNLIK